MIQLLEVSLGRFITGEDPQHPLLAGGCRYGSSNITVSLFTFGRIPSFTLDAMNYPMNY